MWCWRRLESPLDCKEVQPVHPKGDESWVFIGRANAKAETPVFWPPHVKSWLIGKDPDAGRDWGQEEKGTTEDEMAGWHHWLDAHEFEWTPGVGDGQGGLACCIHGVAELDMIEWLNWTEWVIIWFAISTMPKPLTVWITINYGKFWKRWEYQTTWSASWEICMQVRKQQLELDMEQQTGSK